MHICWVSMCILFSICCHPPTLLSRRPNNGVAEYAKPYYVNIGSSLVVDANQIDVNPTPFGVIFAACLYMRTSGQYIMPQFALSWTNQSTCKHRQTEHILNWNTRQLPTGGRLYKQFAYDTTCATCYVLNHISWWWWWLLLLGMRARWMCSIAGHHDTFPDEQKSASVLVDDDSTQSDNAHTSAHNSIAWIVRWWCLPRRSPFGQQRSAHVAV